MAATYDFTLKPHPTIPKPEGPLLVCVLDGYGELGGVWQWWEAAGRGDRAAGASAAVRAR